MYTFGERIKQELLGLTWNGFFSILIIYWICKGPAGDLRLQYEMKPSACGHPGERKDFQSAEILRQLLVVDSYASSDQRNFTHLFMHYMY